MNVKSDLEWQAESDASTMARYQEIINDKARLSRAVKAAQKQASALTKQASVMKAAAQTKRSSKK